MQSGGFVGDCEEPTHDPSRRYPVEPMFERMARRTLPMALLLVCLIVLPACVAGPVAVLGEAGPPPPGLAGPLPQVQVLVVDDEGNPVADAAVRFDGTAPVVTGSDGLAAVDWPGRPVEVSARGPGLRPASAQIESLIEEPLQVMLEPVVLNGRVVTEDRASDFPVSRSPSVSRKR